MPDFFNLNSIMILLIQKNSKKQKNNYIEFKFHYDSNLRDKINHTTELDSLNSIMILLIHDDPGGVSIYLRYLNSIMILLIQCKELEMKEDLNEFKFHYDSINSACSTVIGMRIKVI